MKQNYLARVRNAACVAARDDDCDRSASRFRCARRSPYRTADALHAAHHRRGSGLSAAKRPATRCRSRAASASRAATNTMCDARLNSGSIDPRRSMARNGPEGRRCVFSRELAPTFRAVPGRSLKSEANVHRRRPVVNPSNQAVIWQALRRSRHRRSGAIVSGRLFDNLGADTAAAHRVHA